MKKKKILVIIIVIMIIAAAIGGFIIWRGRSKSAQLSVVDIPVIVQGLNYQTKVKSGEDVWKVLNEVGTIFGFDNPKDVYNSDYVINTDFGTAYQFMQKYRNVPVEGHIARIIVNADGSVSDVINNYVAIAATFTVEPAVTKEAAFSTAAGAADGLKDKIELSSGQLCVLYDEKPILAWKFENPTVACVYVCAEDGKLIEICNQMDTETLDGQKGKVDVDVDKAFESSKELPLIDSIRNITVYVGDVVDDSLIDKESSVISVNRSNNSNDNKSAVDGLANVQKAYDFYENVLNHVSGDGEGYYGWV